jgi:asparagine N-glycosylation enzyme membrane subunit Stt3
VIAFSAYFLYFLFSILGFEFYISVLLSIAFGSLLGYGLNFVVYRKLRERRASNFILLISRKSKAKSYHHHQKLNRF